MKANHMIALALTTSAMLLALGATVAHAEDKMNIRLCTGGADKPYAITGDLIAQQLGENKYAQITIVNSKGTQDNIDQTALTSPATCDAFIGQPDGMVALKRTNPLAASKVMKVGVGPLEFLHVLCSKESGVTDLSQLTDDKKYSVAIGPQGSGGWLIWQNFIAEDDSYAMVQTTSESGTMAMSSVANNDTTCAIIPAALHNADVVQADEVFGDSLVLAGANDKDFNDAEDADGKTLYTWQAIPSIYNKNLQGWFASKDTIAWRAGVYVNKEAFKGHDKALEAFTLAQARAKPAIVAKFGDFE